MKESNSPDLDQHPILPKNPFIRVTASPSASICTSSASIDQESSSSRTATRQSQTSVEDQEVNMLATLPSSIGGLGHMFQGCGTGGNNPAAVQMRLQQLKTSPMLNPHYCMIQRYIDCLNAYIDVCVSSQGAAGVRTWMYEVQWFTTAVQKRAYQRMPLTMEERHAIIQFTTFWRQQSHNPYLMGRPEVQVVLLSLAEVAQS